MQKPDKRPTDRKVRRWQTWLSARERWAKNAEYQAKQAAREVRLKRAA